MPIRTHEIRYPQVQGQAEKVAVISPVTRDNLTAFDEMLQKVQQRWLDEGFSDADVISNDECWELMTKISALFPRVDTPGAIGFDIEPLQTDFEQLRELFFAQQLNVKQSDSSDFDFSLKNFKGCKLYELCAFNAKKKLRLINQQLLNQASDPIAKSDPKTSPSNLATSQMPMPSQT